MRNNPTEAEMCLWQWLKGGVHGYRFRRQVVIGDYIVDFACIKARLIVEVDGEYHNTAEQIQYDKIRTEYLNKSGFQVLRCTNQEVINDPKTIYEHILKYIE